MLSSAGATQWSMNPKSHTRLETSPSLPEKPLHQRKSAGDWFIVWNQTAEVTAYVFPHWGKECQEYGKHILGLFAAFAEEHHPLIFNYDQVVRKQVALQQDLLLTDLADFGDLHVQFLDIRGANSGKQALSGQCSSRRLGDTCLRWNKGTCPATAECCFYQHICLYCHSTSHVNSECTNKPKMSMERGQH
jgi:hypothetical protein